MFCPKCQFIVPASAISRRIHLLNCEKFVQQRKEAAAKNRFHFAKEMTR